MTTDGSNRVVKFAEKPAKPDPIPGNDKLARASMGIYVIAMDRLDKLLTDDADNHGQRARFRQEHHPAVDRSAAGSTPTRSRTWRPAPRATGATSATWTPSTRRTWNSSPLNPELNIYDHQWPIWTYQAQQPPAKFVLDEDGRRGMAVNSMVTGGCIISGAYVTQSLLSTDARIEEGTRVESSVLLPGVSVGRRCMITRCIIDENCNIPDGLQIGLDRELDAKRFYVTEGGVVLVTAAMIKALG